MLSHAPFVLSIEFSLRKSGLGLWESALSGLLNQVLFK